RQNQLDGGLDFVGRVSHAHVLRTLAEADLLVHGAVEESFGMTVVEAMASGVPVVAGRASGAIPWLLEHGAAGVLTDVREPTAIAQATIRVLADDRLRQELIARGRARARELCDPARVAGAYVDTYRAALAGGTRARAEAFG